MNKTISESISVIIPTFNFKDSLIKVLMSTFNQTIKPKQIIIVDSSPSNSIEIAIENFKSKNQKKNIEIILLKQKNRTFPGKARNIGAKYATGSILAFLDSKTIPENSWLEESLIKMNEENLDLVFGKTRYLSSNKKQKIIKDSVYGNIDHVTTPGSLIKSEVFFDLNCFFMENVRTVEDIYWRFQLVNKKLNIGYPIKANLSYSEISNSIIYMQQRFFNYSLNIIKVNIQNNIKELYLSLLIILSAILIPKWNIIVDSYELPFFYLPHITKIYLFLFFFIFFINVLFRYLFTKFFHETFFYLTLKYTIFVLTVWVVLNWNDRIAEWATTSVYYIPHITKIYLITIIIVFYFIRGIYLPIKRKVLFKDIFPFRWILIGFVGISLDIMKAPGYLLGAIFSLKYIFFKQK